jgi:hypothetical protein
VVQHEFCWRPFQQLQKTYASARSARFLERDSPFISSMREGFFGGFMNRNFGPRATLFGAGATPACSIGGFAGATARGKEFLPHPA